MTRHGTEPPRVRASPDDAEARALEAMCLAEGKRGQQLLEQGRIAEARDVFEAVLARTGHAPSYGHAMVLERLGRSLHLSGQPDLAIAHLRKAIDLTGTLPAGNSVKALRGTLRSELGDALRAAGRNGDARKAYEAALAIGEKLGDPRRQGVDLGRLGALALAEGKPEEALGRYQAALARFQQAREPGLEAVVRHQLGSLLAAAQRWDDAERHYRAAARMSERTGDPAGAARSWQRLAVLLLARPGRLAEARQLVERTLAIAQAADPASADVWSLYGILADIVEQEAAAGNGTDAALAGRAGDYRQLERHGPAIRCALDRLGPAPSYGRAVLLCRLGRTLALGGRPDLAAAQTSEAQRIAEQLPSDTGVELLRAMLQSELGGAGEAAARPGPATEGAAPTKVSAGFEVTVYEEAAADHIFEPDLLLEGIPQRRQAAGPAQADPLPGAARPALAPGVRTCLDENGAVRFCLPPAEPTFERRAECTVMRRMRRDVTVSGSAGVLWLLLRHLDGSRNVADLRSELPEADRETGERLLSALAATAVLDVSGRPMGRFLHSATKKGVLPAGGIQGDEVLRLATDGEYVEYAGAPRFVLSRRIPERLQGLHGLTRARRSRRDYAGLPLQRDEIDALLYTACGVTGAMPWADREVKLRAYPSSGALYAVEIYPVVLRADGLEPAVYHYRAPEHGLERLRPLPNRERLVAAALPVEREMLDGAAALICLTGRFRRHERKYGEGGYRMLVAEAGHISQNLILAATALGLSARPFGGVFDDLLNEDLGVDVAEEQFLLAVVVGHTGERKGGHR